MPTPVRYFQKIAQKWGNINPENPEEIEKWFIEEFPKLPKRDLNGILEELLENNSHQNEKPEYLIYPKEVPLPLFKDNIPVSGLSWKLIHQKFTRYLKRSIRNSGNKS